MKIDPDIRLVIIIGLAALVIRVGVSTKFKNRMTPGEPITRVKSEAGYLRDPYMELGDSQQYLALAENLRRTGRFSWDGGAVTFRLPGYPLFLALIRNNLLIMAVLQSVLSALTVVFVGLTARKIFGRVAGVVSAGLMAVDIPNILHCGMVMSESLFVFLISAAVIAFVWQRWWLSGLVWGLACLTRPIAILSFVPFALFLIMGSRRGWLRLLVFVVGFGLLPLSWTVRNYRLFGRLGFSSNGGYNLFYASAGEMVADEMRIPLDSARSVLTRRYLSELTGDNPLALGDRMARIALGIIFQKPGRFLKIYLKSGLRIVLGIKADDMVMRMTEPKMRLAKMGELFKGNQSSLGKAGVIFLLSGVELLTLLGALVLVIVGFFRFKDREERRWASLFVGMALYFIFMAAPLSDGRFRMPAMPFLYLVSGGGLGFWLGRGKAKGGGEDKLGNG